MIKLLLVCGLIIANIGHAETFIIIGEDDWYPYSANINGKLKGFSVDVMEAAFNEVGDTIKIKSMPFSRCMKLVESGEELGCFDTLKDKGTEARYLFPKEYIFNGILAIYARSEFQGKVSVEDLIGQTVGMTNGYTYGPKIDANPNIKKEIVVKDIQSLRMLIAGRVKFSLQDTRVFSYLVSTNRKEFEGKLKLVGIALPAPLYACFSKKHPQSKNAISKLDEGLKKIKSNGVYQKIEKKWDLILK